VTVREATGRQRKSYPYEAAAAAAMERGWIRSNSAAATRGGRLDVPPGRQEATGERVVKPSCGFVKAHLLVEGIGSAKRIASRSRRRPSVPKRNGFGQSSDTGTAVLFGSQAGEVNRDRVPIEGEGPLLNECKGSSGVVPGVAAVRGSSR
jgi:hypothetical protein